MKTKNILLTAVAILFAFTACNNKKSDGNDLADNSMNSLDWQGIYMGTTPCADCEGIETSLQLNEDMTYALRLRYLGKDKAVFENKGTFVWDKNGSVITLKTDGADAAGSQYKVGENKITMLDADAKEVSGELASMYVLNKIETDNRIVEKYWKLVELNGQAVELTEGMREPFLILKSEDNRVNGNSSCNGFFGSYELNEETQRISFSQMGGTMMACMNMELERGFLDMLQNVDNYSINGDRMTLNKARMAPLAVFEAVYLY